MESHHPEHLGKKKADGHQQNQQTSRVSAMAQG
jgi:hypothetical protein